MRASSPAYPSARLAYLSREVSPEYVLRPYLQAKWDEKAEHWIVNDLGKEGSNVNGWHWQEKNKLPWSKQRIDELVKGLSTQLDASIGSAEIKGVKDVTGEVGSSQSECGHP